MTSSMSRPSALPLRAEWTIFAYVRVYVEGDKYAKNAAILQKWCLEEYINIYGCTDYTVLFDALKKNSILA